jgi:glycosyltransferase involved in cell wall biosynthesis
MKNNNDLISIIMPAYNAELFINDSINSVIAQTYSNWELIIIDDGSTDSTAKKVSHYLICENRIQYYYQENGKQGKARNLGITKSKGEYLAFLDADDMWLPDKLKFQIEFIQEKKVDLVFASSYIFNDDEIMDVSRKINVINNVYYDKNSLGIFLERNRIPILTVLVKKDKVINVNGFSELIFIQNIEDYHLWLKLLMSDCVFYSSDNIVAKYRLHDNSVTFSDKFAISKLPDMFFNLLQLYPNYKIQIEIGLKEKFKLIYRSNLFEKAELNIWIKKNTYYLLKFKMQYLYLFLNYLLPTKVTKRVLIYILNA